MLARLARRLVPGRDLGEGAFGSVMCVGQAQGFPHEMAAKVAVSRVIALSCGVCTMGGMVAVSCARSHVPGMGRSIGVESEGGGCFGGVLGCWGVLLGCWI